MYLISEHHPDWWRYSRGPHLPHGHHADGAVSRRAGADATVAVVPMPIEQASEFGVAVVDNYWRVTVSRRRLRIDGGPAPGLALVSMGTTSSTLSFWRRRWRRRGEGRQRTRFRSRHTAKICQTNALFAYDFRRNRVPGMAAVKTTHTGGRGDAGQLLGDAHGLESGCSGTEPVQREWPIRAAEYWHPPAKFVHEEGGRVGRAINSMVSDGCIISGGTVRGSVLGERARHSYSEVIDTVVLDGVEIGRGAVRRAIIDQDVSTRRGRASV